MGRKIQTTLTAKDAKDAKEGQKRGSVITRSVTPIRLAWHPPVAVYLSLAFLRVLCGECFSLGKSHTGRTLWLPNRPAGLSSSTIINSPTEMVC